MPWPVCRQARLFAEARAASRLLYLVTSSSFSATLLRQMGVWMLVHIIDDDEAVARTIARLIRREGWQSLAHPSADAFLHELDAQPFGTIICDIKMPGMSGTELVELLHQRWPEWPVIMVTGHADLTAAVRSFRHGAVHVLEKPFRREELVSALREAAEVGERRRAEVARKEQSISISKLTRREAEVLGALARGLQSKTIAWEFGISTRTVEMHRSNILAKLDARNTSQAVGLYRMAAAA